MVEWGSLLCRNIPVKPHFQRHRNIRYVLYCTMKRRTILLHQNANWDGREWDFYKNWGRISGYRKRNHFTKVRSSPSLLDFHHPRYGGGGVRRRVGGGWCRETPYFLALILKNLIYSFLKNPKQDCSKNFQVWYLARWRETTNWCKISNHQVYSKWGLHLLQNLHEPKDKWTLIVNYPCGGWMKSYPRF